MNTKHMKLNNCLYMKVDLNDPNRVNRVQVDKTNSLKSVNFGNHFRVAYKDLFCMQSDTKVCFALQHVDVTRVTMVPYQLETPWTAVPNESSCRIEHFLLVTEKIKSKVTRKCDLGQVDVLEEGVDDPTHVLEEEQF